MNWNKLLLLCALWIVSKSGLFAQPGGKYIFRFLDMPVSARQSALGNGSFSFFDSDVTMATDNPSLLTHQMHQAISFNQMWFPSKIKNTYFGYGHHQASINTTFHAGIQYLDYGTQSITDELGNANGTFRPADYSILIGAGRKLGGNLSIGTQLKFVGSQFEAYNSYGVLGDVAATYFDTTKRLGVALLFQNFGTQLNSYSGTKEPVPFNISFALSKRLKHIPLRLNATLHSLNRWNLLYDNPNEDTGSIFIDQNQTESAFSKLVDNFFRHIIFGGEFSIGKKEQLRLRIAYNHQRRREHTVTGYRSLAGFSGGFGINIKQFRLDYGYAKYHLGGTSHQFSLSTQLSRFKKA